MSEESNTSSSNTDATGGGRQCENLLPVEIEEEEEEEEKINISRFNKEEGRNTADNKDYLDDAWPDKSWPDLSNHSSSQSDPRRYVVNDSVIGVVLYPDPPPQESFVAPILVYGDTDYDSNNTYNLPLQGRTDANVIQNPSMFQVQQRTQSEVEKSLVRLKEV